MSHITVATLTVSDTRTSSDDVSGQLLVSLLSAAGLTLMPHRILPDDPELLRTFLADLSGKADAAVLTGGTGIAPRDRTYEALTGIFDKQLDGFGEAFRRLSWDAIGPRAILSRAVAGVMHDVVIFSLPGSPPAVELGVTRLILPVLTHAVDLARGRASHR